MDSRRCSAALGFTLLISCVIGIVILIYNSGSSRRSSELSTSSSTMQHNHNHRQSSSTTIVGGKAGGGGDHFGSSPKDGFANDPNYRSSQPTMQEVNDLADELHRLLSSKSKHVLGTSGSNGKGNPVNTGTVTSIKKTNGSLTATSSSATSSVKASISAVNYSSVPKKSSFGLPPGAAGSMTQVPPTAVSSNSSSPRRNHTLASSRQEGRLNPHSQQNLQHNHHSHNQKPYPGHQSPPSSIPPSPGPMDSAERGELEAHENPGRGGSGGGGLAHNDLYTASWQPSMVSPAGGGMVAPNHPHYHHHVRNHPQSRRPHSHNNNPQPPRSSSPAKINKTGKGTGLPLNQHQSRVPNPKEYHRYQHYGQDHEKEEMEQYEDGDFVEVDDDDEDDVSSNLDNVKKEEEWDDGNDVVDDNEEDEEEDEEEEDEEDNGANPSFLMEPKNLAADLETLFSLANHLYTSPASLLSTFSSAQAKTNSTKKTDNQTFGFPAAFQGFLKVVNETIQRGNNSKLLVDLNEMYQGREARMTRDPTMNKVNSSTSNSTSGGDIANSESSASEVMKNGEDKHESPYEKSLTAFVFMSFGVFLLNQIHSFVQKTADEHMKHHNFMSNGTMASEGRALPWEDDGPFTWYKPKNEMMMTSESSSLDILFQPPVSLNKSLSALSENTSNSVSGRSSDHSSLGAEDSFLGEDHVNNMFRALLNIGNAYTKDSPALECIWSLYCQDLDQTAHKRGLYGVAARINSVGLRLIMKQIPPELTFDVILRSLVGWDGLPCRKMFPDCSVRNGTMVPGEEGGAKRLAANVL